MNPNRLIVFLFFFATVCHSARAQTLAEWQTVAFRCGLDTTGLRLDSAGISHLCFELAYGKRPERLSFWNITQHPDSARVKAVVQLLLSKPSDWAAQLHALEPQFRSYRALRQCIDSLLALGQDSAVRWSDLRPALNDYRWLNRMPAETVVVVNLPSASLQVLDRRGGEPLRSRVIVGSSRTPTPLFGAYLTRVITYPYWNVPRSIATRELLPKIRRNPAAVLDELKMQVLNPRGRAVSPDSVPWASLSATNFPYRLRQSTGCDNALGVMKFDINSPFDIYLHDTNHRELFAKKDRFLSHGCIRVARPVELANLLLGESRFPADFLSFCPLNPVSRSYALPGPVPVVLLYQTVGTDTAAGLVYYPDVYGWRKQRF